MAVAGLDMTNDSSVTDARRFGDDATACQPAGNDFARMTVVERFVASFQEMTGLSLQVLPGPTLDPALLLAVRKHLCCRLITDTAPGRRRYLKTLAGVRQEIAKRAPSIPMKCAADLSHVAIPVWIGNDHVATFLVGAVRLHQPRPKDFAAFSRLLRKCGVNRELRRFERAYFRTPVMTPKQFRAAVGLVTTFTQYLQVSPHQWRAEAVQTEPSCVKAAKEFIHQHFREPIDVPTLSGHAKLCREHFSRVFKQSAGVTILEYLTRVRIEHAKRLLADKNQRVTEVAFASGFNSIPHFNRAFRKLTGQSPTTYRRAQRS